MFGRIPVTIALGVAVALPASASFAAETRHAKMRVTAEVVRSCQVSADSGDVRLSCAASNRPAVSAVATTARGTIVPLGVVAGGSVYTVFTPMPPEPEVAASGPIESQTHGDPVTGVVVNIRL